MNDDKSITGYILGEDDDKIKLKLGTEERIEVMKKNVKSRMDIPSSMPAVEKILSIREIRDLVAFLSGLKSK